MALYYANKKVNRMTDDEIKATDAVPSVIRHGNRSGLAQKMIDALMNSDKTAVYVARPTKGAMSGLQYQLKVKIQKEGLPLIATGRSSWVNEDGEELQNVVFLAKADPGQ